MHVSSSTSLCWFLELALTLASMTHELNLQAQAAS